MLLLLFTPVIVQVVVGKLLNEKKISIMKTSHKNFHFVFLFNHPPLPWTFFLFDVT